MVAAAASDMPTPPNVQPTQHLQVPLGNVPYMPGPLGMHPIAALANQHMLNPGLMQLQGPSQQNPGQAMNQGPAQINPQLAQMAQQQIQGMSPGQGGQGMPPGVAMGPGFGGINLPHIRGPMFNYGPAQQFNLSSFPPGSNGVPGWLKAPGGQPHSILQSLHAQQMLNEGAHPEGGHGANPHPQHGMSGGHHPQSQHDDDVSCIIAVF